MKLRDHERYGFLLRIPLGDVFLTLDVADHIELLLIEWLYDLLVLTGYDIVTLGELKLRVTEFELMHPAKTHWFLVLGPLFLIVEDLQGYSLLNAKIVFLLGDLPGLVDV